MRMHETPGPEQLVRSGVTLTEESAAPARSQRPSRRSSISPRLDGLRGSRSSVYCSSSTAVSSTERLPRRRRVLRVVRVPDHHVVARRARQPRSHLALGHFWARRARRLLPALVGVLGGRRLRRAFIARRDEPDRLHPLGRDLHAVLLRASGTRSCRPATRFAIFRSPSPLQHTWSLAIEEQFYLVWPLVLVVGPPAQACSAKAAREARARAHHRAGRELVRPHKQLLYTKADPSQVYYGTDTRSRRRARGAAPSRALAAWGPVRGARAPSARGGGLDRGRAARHRVDAPIGELELPLPSAASLLLRLGGHHRDRVGRHPPGSGWISTALSFKPLCWLGIISYGVYLWHWPIFLWCNGATHRTLGLAVVAHRSWRSLLRSRHRVPYRIASSARSAAWMGTPA